MRSLIVLALLVSGCTETPVTLKPTEYKPTYKVGNCYYHKSDRELESWEKERLDIVYVAEIGKSNYLLLDANEICASLRWSTSTCQSTRPFRAAESYYNTPIECP